MRIVTQMEAQSMAEETPEQKKTVFFEECFFPRDRTKRSEVIANRILYYTHKPVVYANNPNNPQPN